MKEYSVFDILGPNMIGPSSSHTAGACRLGYMAHKLARGSIAEVAFHLHGSFAKTYRGHGTDKALLGGILGMLPDDERLRDAFHLAREQGINFNFIEADLGADQHPNTVRIDISKVDGQAMTILGSSIGGGNIRITEIDGVSLVFTGEYPTLIIPHRDRLGMVGRVTSILGQQGVNIAFMRVYRQQKGKVAYMIIETDGAIGDEVFREITRTEGVTNAYLVSLN
ncbi:MAG: L-serine dehydratase, beta chain [Firmicutes bacterium]|nr:L-serine dehydratase, beta chain [candidate division NPL-UPA2 bacterium]